MVDWVGNQEYAPTLLVAAAVTRLPRAHKTCAGNDIYSSSIINDRCASTFLPVATRHRNFSSARSM